MLSFFVALVWGLLSAQFFVQIILCLIITAIGMAGIVFSPVSKTNNILASGIALFQVLLFGAVFVAGKWFTSKWIDYESWNVGSITAVLAFLASAIYCSLQIPGKLLLARMCSWRPMFFEASNALPSNERVAFAKKIAREKA